MEWDLGGGGVDGAIHRAAGPALLEACRAVPEVSGIRCPVGQARITSAGNLKAQYVIHTVGPRYGIDQPSASLLRAAYTSSLELASKHTLKRIAFPAVSCGVYGYPIDEAAKVAFKAASDERFASMEILFYLYPQDVYKVWNEVLAGL